MNDSYIVSGVLFGDEGKGTICDYLTNKYDINENVRYNGGSQASHTVVSNGITHKFSQLGSSSLNNDTRTYLSDNTIVNPFNIITEAKNLSEKLGISTENILKRIFVDKNASIVTPYHSLINKIRELSDKENRTGSVGSGVSEVNKLKLKTGIDIKVSDLINCSLSNKLLELFDYTSEYLKTNRSKINDRLFEALINEKDVYYLTNPRNREYMITCYKNLIDSNLLNIVSSINEFHRNNSVLFEGSQGLLLDRNYGIKPNTTSLDTTNKYGIKLAHDIGSNVHTIGCVGSVNSRHGYGILPTYDKYLQSIIYDENQNTNYFQGNPRYGWIDTVLIRYSLNISPVNEVYLSYLDWLKDVDEIKICDSYVYYGEVDEEFENTFEYYFDENKIIIKNIKQNSDYLRTYLSKCIPLYITLDGFKKDISNIKNYYDLPYQAINYIELIEYLIKTNITMIGVGRDRCQKLERRVRWI